MRVKRVLLWSVAVIAAVYVALVAALYAFQRQLIYLPDRRRPDAASAGVPGLRVVEITTADRLRLLAWYLPPRRPDGLVVAYFHGNGGNIGYRIDHLQHFAAAGWGVLLVDYRGYGGNPGAPSEAGLYQDARAALVFLQASGIAPSRIVLYGESLGTGVAVRMASEQKVAALLLESPYTSLVAVAQYQYPYVPVGPLLKDRFDALSRIASVEAPILVMQGGRDRVIPRALGRALYDAAAAPKEIWFAPQAGHNDLAAFGAIEAAIDFVRRHMVRE